jgi:hypothetical protein
MHRFSSNRESKEADLPEAIRGYDWDEAFKYADFDREDVAEVLATEDGENDSDNWVGVFLLKDGRYAYLTAGCDYTGWDCQASGNSETRATLAEIIRECMTDDDRRRLNMPLPEDKNRRGRK